MRDEDKALKIMAEENLRLIKKSIDRATVNRTVYGRVIEPLGNNKYRMMINGGEYTVRSHWEHNVNDVVVIIVCNNNWQNLYVLY